MTPILTAAQMREADRRAIESLGIPGLVLMENAARGACDVLAELLDGLDGRAIAIVCGKGNNGGDGMALARHALLGGADVVCALLAPADQLSPDAAAQHVILKAFAPEALMSWEAFVAMDADFDAIVDAALGTGASGTLGGVYVEAMRWCNECGGLKLAIDVPTGVNADTGAADHDGFAADATATMAALKPGLLLREGATLSGDLYAVHIGAPAVLYESSGLELLDAERAIAGFPAVRLDRDKYDRGKVLVVAGSRGMTGAAVMAAEAALRCGAGLTVLAMPDAALVAMPQRLPPEIMTLALRSDTDGAFAADALDGIDTRGFRAIVIGPGMSRAADTAHAVRALVRRSTATVVLDADGLNAFVASPAELAERAAPLVITPHHGEMARLLGRERAMVAADPIGTAREAAAAWNCLVVLKGAPTVVAAPDGRAWINGAGNPGMASGGMGDVLAGMTGALTAQADDPLDATLAAVYLHSHAADLAAEAGSVHAITASDVIAWIPRAYRTIGSEHEG